MQPGDLGDAIVSGALGWTRTTDTRHVMPLLYPPELRAHKRNSVKRPKPTRMMRRKRRRAAPAIRKSIRRHMWLIALFRNLTVRTFYPSLIAHKIAAVQPLESHGEPLIYYVRN